MATCDRCGATTLVTTMSWFSKDIICMDCSKRERQHPQFAEAQTAVHHHEAAGDMNWHGIGVPDDLLPQ